MIPNKKQWAAWTLPSKYSALGVIFGLISIGYIAVDYSLRENEIDHQWYIGTWIVNVEKTSLSIPEKYSEYKKPFPGIDLEYTINNGLKLSKYVFGIIGNRE